MPLIFLTSGSSWLVPDDCFVLDWVDCLAAGGGGYTAAGNRWRGSGGAWSRGCIGLRVTPKSNLPFGVGVGGNGPAFGGDTFFNATSLADAQAKGVLISCAAEGGKAAHSATQTLLGGQASNGVGVSKYSGGNGSYHPSSSLGVGAGGGAAGPNGNGVNATDAPSGGYGYGGAGDAGFGGAGGAGGSSLGQPGQPGHEYDASHGSGGGGGGGGNPPQNSNGGAYGGGAGAPTVAGNSVGGNGLIVLSYTPGKGGPSGFNMPMMGL